jgi:hypothetical protein
MWQGALLAIRLSPMPVSTIHSHQPSNRSRLDLTNEVTNARQNSGN